MAAFHVFVMLSRRGLLDRMNVNHRQGLTQVDILPECPRRPVEAKLQQHARDYGWNVLKGLLMYLVSLGLAIKVLLYARGYTSNVEIWSECLSIVLLIIASTLRRSKQEAFECGVWDKEEPGCFMGAQTV